MIMPNKTYKIYNGKLLITFEFNGKSFNIITRVGDKVTVSYYENNAVKTWYGVISEINIVSTESGDTLSFTINNMVILLSSMIGLNVMEKPANGTSMVSPPGDGAINLTTLALQDAKSYYEALNAEDAFEEIAEKGLAEKLSTKNSIGKYFNDSKIGFDSDFTIDGAPIISNPDSLIYISAIGKNGSTVVLDTVGSKGGYSPSLGGDSEGISSEYNDYAYYPYYINRPDPNNGRYGHARWRLVNKEYPSGILEYFYNHDSITSNTTAFVKGNVAYVAFDISNINDMRYGITLKSSEGVKNFTGGYETNANGKSYIAIKDNTSGLWYALACTNMAQYQVCADSINVTLGLDTTKTSVANSACSVAVGCGSTGNGETSIVFCSSIGIDKDSVVNAVLAGLTNWKDKLVEAENDWAKFYEGMGNNLAVLTTEQRAKYYLCIQQIRSLMYNGYMSAGMPNWYKNFIRDTSWTAYALCNTKNSKLIKMAVELIDWFTGIDDFTHANSFSIDKKRCETSMNQTDSACTFLLAVGKLCEVSGYNAVNLKPVMDVALSYIKQNFVEADRHVTALHAHDFWDDYVTDIIHTTDVKYESMIDVLWIVALQAITPVYIALDDKTTAAYCISTYNALLSKLEDFRNPEGGMYYAIKPDGTIYDTVEALPGTLYAAWLLNDDKCKEWIIHHGERLRAKGGLTLYPLNHSNTKTNHLNDNIWMPYAPIIALIAYMKGDGSLVDDLARSFRFGGFPEYGQISKASNITWYSHAYSFPWADAMYLVLISKMVYGM